MTGSKASSESLYSDSDSEDNGQDIFSSLDHRNQSPLGKPPDVVAFELAMKECNRWLKRMSITAVEIFVCAIPIMRTLHAFDTLLS